MQLRRSRALKRTMALAIAVFLTAQHAAAAILHVRQDSPGPASPYETWFTAAHTIQAAVDAAQPGDTVLVTNGLYSAGGRAVNGGTVTNRVAIQSRVLVKSIQGPLVTIIQGGPGQSGYNNGHGDNAVRCAYVGSNAVLSGFTLTNGHTQAYGTEPELDGGGALCEADGGLTNCILAGNSAFRSGGGACNGLLEDCLLIGNTAGYGGGTFQSFVARSTLRSNVASYGGGAAGGFLTRCTLSGNSAFSLGGGAQAAGLNNCLLLGNIAHNYGGGAVGGFLTNCTLVGNAATNRGGGAYNAALVNCIIYHNAAPLGSNTMFSTLDFSCTTPLPAGGTANIDLEPRFVNRAGDDYRLRYASACIDAGIDFGAITNDFLGAQRVVDGDGDGIAFADIGAYEYDSRTVDSDGDGATDEQEQAMDTSPVDAGSCLRINALPHDFPGAVQFPSSSNRLYTLEFSTTPGSRGWAQVPGSIDVRGNSGTLTLMDTNAEDGRFYRISARLP